MSFAISFLIVFAMLLLAGLATVRRFFLTSDAGGYVFVAISWTVLALVAAVFTWLLGYLGLSF